MHRCQVKMRHDYDTPEDHLIECGDTANKKIGLVWVCDEHFNTFQHVVDDLGEARLEPQLFVRDVPFQRE